MYMFNWKRARAQLKHAHVQLKACICTTEVCICWYVGVKRAYAQLVACTCSQLLLYHKCTIFSLEHTAGHTGDLLISKMKMSNFSMKHSTNFVLKWYLLHAGKCKSQNVAEMHFWTDIWTKSHFMSRNIKRENEKKKKTFFIFVYIKTFHKLCSEMIFTSCGKM